MHVAIIHYHLRPGGVTRVIEQAVESLRRQDIIPVVLCGEPPAQPLDNVDVRVVEGLAYEDDISACLSADSVLEELRQAARDALGQAPDIWNIHNHSLGKNRIIPQLVRRLAEDGDPMLLQPHDFAEDGRPDNYRLLSQSGCDNGYLYPVGEHILYGTLNGRDAAFLENAGMPSDRVRVLGNPVSVSIDDHEPRRPDEGALYVYPTRAIRRKNIGETLFLSLFAKPADRFAITLAPDNPAWQPVYREWVRLAEALTLPVMFEASKHYQGGFPTLLRDATAIFTTSIAEGFGLAFLEPWLIGKPLLGRALPEITRDFTAAGFDLDALYTFLGVPTEWIDQDALTRKLRQGLEHAYNAYGRTLAADAVDTALAASCQGDLIDFGRLDEELQRQVIRRLAAEPSPSFAPSLEPADPATIEANRKLAQEHYSPDHYGNALAALFRQAVEATDRRIQPLDDNALLDQFLKPERFCLLRTS